METADQFAETLIQHGRFNEAVDISQRILSQDNCWERAYRHLMLAYDRLGDRGQMGRTYRKCVQTLRDELNVAPSPETDTLYTSLISK